MALEVMTSVNVWATPEDIWAESEAAQRQEKNRRDYEAMVNANEVFENEVDYLVELAKLKANVEKLRDEYESRIKWLEGLLPKRP